MSALNAAWLAGTFGSTAAIVNWSTVGAKTGSISGIAANAPVFAFQNSGRNLAWIIGVSVAFNLTTAFTTAQAINPSLFVCRAFTTTDSGGVQLALTGTNNGLRRTAQPSFSSCDMRISATAALVTGIRTPDVTPVGIVNGWASAIGNTIPMTNLFAYDEGDYPLALAPSEGFEIQLLTAMGAVGVGALYVVAELAEISGPSFPV